MTIEKMKMWLDAMENELAVDFMDAVAVGEAAEKLCDAIASLRQAIAEAEGQEKALQALHNENERLGLYKDAYAEQGPAAWNRGVPPLRPQQKEGETFIVSYEAAKPQSAQEPVIDKSAAIRIATTLGWEPKREWIGLTDEDWVEIFGNSRTIGAAVRNTEAKLKEKNT